MDDFRGFGACTGCRDIVRAVQLCSARGLGHTDSAMRTIAFGLALGAVLGLASCASSNQGSGHGRRDTADPQSASAALFVRAAAVFQHPRCANCHPTDDYPRQGMDSRRHALNVQRGPANRGVPVMRCSACHQDANQEHAGVPGAPGWALAPRSMGWMGMSAGDICRGIQDPAQNGDRSLAALIEHLSHDPLVLWAWRPGADREPPPIPLDEFRALIRAWADSGAACPA